MARLARLKREAQYLKINPTPGVVCQPRDDCLDIWDAGKTIIYYYINNKRDFRNCENR